MSTDKLSEQVKTREDLYKKGKPVEMSKEEADMIMNIRNLEEL